ncbi:unnamed protein product [Owenia fusiformis]|uniref:Uncharacterized protein n=1 Tax=Owenia fusiformis TaxID=6347 RepID=A0A8J1UYE7_OWEFU|nr:unnamed protein product [Owenia fusiformis]
MDFLEQIVTSDESSIGFYTPENAQQSAAWQHDDSPTPSKPKLMPGVPMKKQMIITFFDFTFFERQHITGGLRLRLVTMMGLNIAMAIEEMHSNGIIHCDVKPENILVFSDKTRKRQIFKARLSEGTQPSLQGATTSIDQSAENTDDLAPSPKSV